MSSHTTSTEESNSHQHTKRYRKSVYTFLASFTPAETISFAVFGFFGLGSTTLSVEAALTGATVLVDFLTSFAPFGITVQRGEEDLEGSKFLSGSYARLDNNSRLKATHLIVTIGCQLKIEHLGNCTKDVLVL